MRTTLTIDDHLYGEVMELTGATSKTEAIRKALQEFVRWRRKQQLLALRGRLDFADDLTSFRDLDGGDSE